jgi:hypothetical protein
MLAMMLSCHGDPVPPSVRQDQHVGPHGDDAGDGHSAFLPAGELKRRFFEHLFRDAHKTGRFINPLPDLIVGELHVFRAEGDVFVYGVFKELVFRVLKDQSDTEPDRPQDVLRFIDVAAVYENCSGNRLIRPFKCWIKVDFPDPVCPMIPRNSPFSA